MSPISQQKTQLCAGESRLDLVIGTELKSLTEDMLGLGERLRDILDDSLASRIGDALNAVKKQHCSIAVLGQIKAGKSSFVNALIGRPGLLPTDVNPWTAVVTRLQFAMPGQPRNGALFTFFDENEWHRFAQNGGGISELAARLVPDHEEARYQQNLEAMRRRAELRLGRHYHHLFGKTRSYADATPEVIERYVCLGQHIEETSQELAPGRYADITKTADVFFETEPFASPVTVIDTPGTNDPLLIRDEITMRAIEDADVYVVVLTAQQPLTASDIALLRILHGLRKSRIVVFINRIDDLTGGVSSGSQTIADAVQAVIGREFPGARIPVVVGSASWANSALDMTADASRLLTPELAGYARDTGAMGPHEQIAASPERMREVLFACSGIPAIASHLSALMLRGTNGYWLYELGQTLLATASSVTSAARSEIAALTSAMNGGEEPALAKDLENSVAHLQRLAGVAADVENYQIAAEKYLRQEVAESVISLRRTLEDHVAAFASEQSRAVHHAWLQGENERTWRCNAVPLRNALEEHVLHTFWEAGKRLIDTERQAAPELRKMLQDVVPGINLQLTPTSLLNFNLTPSLTPLSRAVVFDLEDRWWQLWWRRAHSAEEKAQKIRELVTAEFSPVVAELASSVEADLEKYILMAIRRFFSRAQNVLRGIAEKEEKLARTYEALLAAAAEGPPLPREQQQRIDDLQAHAAAGDELTDMLKACLERCLPLIQDQQRAAT